MKIKNVLFKDRRVFIFGVPGSGKSTLAAAIVRYIDYHKDMKLRRNPSDNREGVLLMREWAKCFKNNQFPLQTDVGSLKEVVIEYQPVGSFFRPNRVTILEVSGEDVIKLEPTHSSHKEAPKEVVSHLAASDSVVIVASCVSNNVYESEIIRDFIEYLVRTKYKKPICLLLSKYDLVRGKGKDYVEVAQGLYLGAMKILHDMPRANVLPFSIGVASESAAGVFFPDELSSKYVADIFDWITQ